MATDSKDLAELRQAIDAIDDQIHDLLIERTEIVHHVAKVKNEAVRKAPDSQLVPSLAMRPAREAEILRRLDRRHRGELPFHVIVQLWRELINAKTRLQGPLTVALYAPGEASQRAALQDLARACYGAATPLEVYATPFDALDAVFRKPGVIGVLPLPEPGEADPWWPHLLAFEGTNQEGFGGPKIIARLPFLLNDPLAPAYPDALTLACMDQQPGTEDATYVIAATSPGCESEEVEKAFSEEWLEARIDGRVKMNESQDLILMCCGHYVAPEDTRLDGITAKCPEIAKLEVVGGYPFPICRL